MRLSTRIMISYGYLATLLLVGAGSAALAFQRLGDNINSVLGENFESVQAGISMLESLERQDSGALSLLLGQDEGRAQVKVADTAFLAALDAARSNITITTDEPAIILRIEEQFGAYRRIRDEVLEEPANNRLIDYQTQALPRFGDVKAGVRELIDVNHAAMMRADDEAQRAATANASLHALLIALALLSLAPLSASMRRHVLDRLEELREVSTAISAGDLGRRLDDRHLDELGLASRQLNRVLDRHEILEAELAGHRARERTLVRSLLANMPQPAVLFSPSGQPLESTVDVELEAVIRGAAQEQVEGMDEPAKAEFTVAGRRVMLVPLKPASGPEVAWLALLRGDTDGK